MKQVAIISDTHLSMERLPTWVENYLRRADHTIHAGDVDTRAGIDRIRRLSRGPLTAVRGNWDADTAGLPVVETVEIEGVTFVVTHGTTGRKNDYIERVISTVTDHTSGGKSTIGVAGHTHKVLNRVVSDIRVLNPGSATGVYPATTATIMLVDVEDDDFSVKVLQEGVPSTQRNK